MQGRKSPDCHRLSCALGAVVLIAAGVSAGVVYENDFETSVGSEWSTSQLDVTPSGRIFFASNQYDTLSYLRLSIMSRMLDAPAQTAVLSASSDDSLLFPDISKDGKKVCFTVAKFDREKIQEVERYYRSNTNDREWFESARKDLETDVSYEIWTANTNGSSKSYLTPGRKGVFSPDGTKIAFLSRDRQGRRSW